eukprot:CAMPEP_0178409008 /NCGR_PEP_ID=MMETSP0689_2-20121128/20238_1 /TAXON_ID=160604 /ORGANISM="Amphidinium massartii, Strain CS-259" /LENGTH=387 /DNA_ID=CAMNT_0020030131 /DNA_START=31 /DNA_END=1192 /DNA_ORIENTATION=+
MACYLQLLQMKVWLHFLLSCFLGLSKLQPVAAVYFAPEVLNQRKYLIASVPHSKQVVYCQPPDNVWRPLVLNNVTTPTSVAVDSTHNRLYVADPPAGRIYWYNLIRRSNGFLMTSGLQYVAVHGYVAHWIAVNGQGDLYFTGHEVVRPPQSVYDAIYRQDIGHIEAGNALDVVEVYSRSNSGVPSPKVFMPSGIAVDTFYIFWGNQDQGSVSGSVNKASRQNIETKIQVMESLTNSINEVRGLAASDGNVYYIGIDGVHGVAKAASGSSTAATLVAHKPVDPAQEWDPKSLAYDGGGTLYVSDFLNGKVYSMAGSDLNPHNMSFFADAVGVHGLAPYEYQPDSDPNQELVFAEDSASAGHTVLVPLAVVLLVRLLAQLPDDDDHAST